MRERPTAIDQRRGGGFQIDVGVDVMRHRRLGNVTQQRHLQGALRHGLHACRDPMGQAQAAPAFPTGAMRQRRTPRLGSGQHRPQHTGEVGLHAGPQVQVLAISLGGDFGMQLQLEQRRAVWAGNFQGDALLVKRIGCAITADPAPQLPDAFAQGRALIGHAGTRRWLCAPF